MMFWCKGTGPNDWIDPFRAEVELSEDGAAISACTLYFGSAKLGLGCTKLDTYKYVDVASIDDWIFTFTVDLQAVTTSR